MKVLLHIVFCLLSLNAVAQNDIRKRPNILMIAIDDLNDFVGAMGHSDAITPNIDRLAARGTLFTNAQCQAPLCGPSRASVMTGLRPSSTGIYGMISDNNIQEVNDLTRNTVFMHQYFKNNGYILIGAGKIFHQYFPDGLLDVSGGPSEYGPLPEKRFVWDKKGTGTDWGVFPGSDEEMPDHVAAKWAAGQLKKDYDQPFFLSVGFIRPHVPWYVPQKWFDLYDTADIHLPPYLKTDRNDLPEITKSMDDWPMMPTADWALESHQWKNILKAYLACISFTDHQVGIVLDALEKSPNAGNTIVILWSDHGYRLGEKNVFAKVCLWDRATRVPLLFAGPGIPANKKSDIQVELLSVYPTLTDLAGLPHNLSNEGHSLLPLIRQEKVKWEHPAITTWGRNNHAVKTQNFRYIHYEDGSEELYDILKDPNEWYNLAGEKKYGKTKSSLQKLLPKVNVHWAEASYYNANEYFREQKKRESAN